MDFKVLNNISYGMYVIATKYNGKNVGCFVNTVTQLTSEKPLLSVCINKNNYTNEALKNVKKFSISILSEESEPQIIGTFGFHSSKEINKFEGVSYEEIDGLPILNDKVCGNIICEVENIIDAETHEIFIARVIDTKSYDEKLTPMTYKFYHEVIKGKAPKTAPTYQEDNVATVESSSENKKYRCKICGHIYDEGKENVKFKDLPETWVCPLCGVGKALFEEVQ